MFKRLTPYYAADKETPRLTRTWRRWDCQDPASLAGCSDFMKKALFCYGFTRNHILQEQYESA